MVVSSISIPFSLGFLMPRKKYPSPSTLPPRRSTRGASKSTSLIDGEDVESPVVPLVRLGDTQEGYAESLQPPPLTSGTNMCNLNKEILIVPSVSVSLDESERGLGPINKDELLKKSAAAGVSLARKPGFAGNSAGLWDSDSSGSPGIQSLHTGCGNNPCMVNESVEIGYAIAGSTPPVTPLFSPEFKAMLGREYLRKTVFSPRPSLSGEATGGRGLWDGLAQRRSESIRESGSLPVVHGPLPDVHMHVHVPGEGAEHGSAMHSAHAKVGTTLSSGIALDEGVQASTDLGNGVHVSTEMGKLVHGGGDLPMPSSSMVEVVQDVGENLIKM
ncbi:hypothetical protein L1987_53690 [Smallanthus sonchifolius]|uniref:Uncharacterized protein n=1 Tax=Smallanthus sonchifolius TaxID=185202 RepID=A0ACB9EWM7_9ASTR|nr:hypothetical protein L1987_53690 [Smallanthus sonchifolius]